MQEYQKNIYSADLFFVHFAGDERGQDVCGWTRKISPKLKPSVLFISFKNIRFILLVIYEPDRQLEDPTNQITLINFERRGKTLIDTHVNEVVNVFLNALHVIY